MTAALKFEIETIVNNVPSGYIFDSHFVIATLKKNPSDECHRFCAGFLQTKGANAQLSRQIGRCDVERMKGFAWSDNIRGNPGACAYWRRS